MDDGDASLESPEEWRVKPMQTALRQAPGGAMKIGALAARSGLPVKTLRYYEDLGLLPAIGRTEGGYRLFSEQSLRRLEFIRRLKTLGLSLEEIQSCLSVHDAGELPCHDIQVMLNHQIERIERQINDLDQLRTELEGLLAGWRSHPAREADLICPNLRL
jgi:MerR family transcriptional regulator, copper efflux regulator